MADIKSIAEALVRLSTKEVNELATVMKDEYGIEAAASIEDERQRIENAYNTMSPKEYGIYLMNKRHRNRHR